ncbi:hypothetical protein HN51_071392 [Arachis hypogaea]
MTKEVIHTSMKLKCICFLEKGYVTYLNGVCHWRGGDKNGKEVLVSFNLSTETFQTTLIGWQQSDDIDCLTRTLVVLNDSVALISSFDENSHIEISILGEVGVKESWVKLFTIGPFPYIWHPMIMGNKCDIIFFMGNENHELASFDVISGKIMFHYSNGSAFKIKLMIRDSTNNDFFTETLNIYTSSMISHTGGHGNTFTHPLLLKACANLGSISQYSWDYDSWPYSETWLPR